MRDTKATRRARYFDTMQRAGFSYTEADTLRRCEMTLQRWSEKECGDGSNWAIERDEDTGKPFNVYHGPGESRRYPIADREAGAIKRAQAILKTHPDYVLYHQGDPRGCALYVVRKSDMPKDNFVLGRDGDKWTVRLNREDNTPYNIRFDTRKAAQEFADRETVNMFYTRGIGCCID